MINIFNWRMSRKYKKNVRERRVMVQKPWRIMISSLYEKRIGAILLSLVTVHKCDVRNSESSTGSIEGKKEAKRHPVSHAAPRSRFA